MNKQTNKNCLIWLFGSLFVFGMDFGTKQLVLEYLAYANPLKLLPIFDLTLLYNTGAAFSFLAGEGGWQRWLFVIISIAVSLLLVIWMKRTDRKIWWLGLAYSFILGGALGNLYDRVFLGYVIDFISIHYGNYFFPAFNLADSAITLGATILIFDILLLEPERKLSRTNQHE